MPKYSWNWSVGVYKQLTEGSTRATEITHIITGCSKIALIQLLSEGSECWSLWKKVFKKIDEITVEGRIDGPERVSTSLINSLHENFSCCIDDFMNKFRLTEQGRHKRLREQSVSGEAGHGPAQEPAKRDRWSQGSLF